MLRYMIVLSALGAGFSPSSAMAAPHPNGAYEPGSATPGIQNGVRLAQSGNIEIYFDGRGRRVIVDAVTGEILAVERPGRPFNRQQLRRAQRARELNRNERYYLDDPEDMARLRREKARERGLDLRDDPRRDDFYRDDQYGGDSFGQFPEPPRAPGDYYDDLPFETFRTEPQDQPEIVTRQPVERQPLPEVNESRNNATVENPFDPRAAPRSDFRTLPAVAGLQVLLDRAGASPGVVDGKFGSNVDKALATYRQLTGNDLKSTDSAGIKEALAESGGDPFTTYTITAEDAAGPYVASVPSDYGEKAKLERLGFTSVSEMLAERFHMDERYLRSLNPDANFGRPGTVINVANVGSDVKGEVSRIVADKSRKQVRAYDAAGKLVAAYPATIGSADTPSPTGTHAVSRVAFDPQYTYNPKVNFKQGANDKILTIPPGPNGPVGSIWIALDKPTYGIHGTPDPSKIGKTESHGCVRLTNWDAQELARIVKPGVIVQFTD